MRRWMTIVGLVGVSMLVWWALGFWIASGSERFYLLVPPVSVGIVGWLVPDGWRILRMSLSTVLMYVAVLTVCFTAYNLFQAALLMPPGQSRYWEGFSFREVFTAVYFIAAIRLVLEPPLRLARRPLRFLLGKLFLVPELGDSRSVRLRRLLQKAMPEFVLALVIFPFILGTLYIHRFKLPNAASPLDVADRPFENVAFQTDDGLTIRGWFIPAVSGLAPRTLIICHGLGANRSNFLPYLAVGDELGANVLMFDFRGHGESDGHTVTFGYREVLDVCAAVDYLRSQRPEQAQELIGLGISMGSSGLIRAAAQVSPPLQAVIVDSAFAAAVELTDRVLAPFPAVTRPVISAPGVLFASLAAECWLPNVRPIEQIPDVRAPLLIIHAKDDELIPVQHAHRLFQSAVEPKSLWISNTGGHGSSLAARDEYFQHIKDLLAGTRVSMNR